VFHFRFSVSPWLFLEDLPCAEESGLHSNADGIEQISTTFQKLRKIGIEGEEKQGSLSP
jgi:hypothetical protein